MDTHPKGPDTKPSTDGTLSADTRPETGPKPRAADALGLTEKQTAFVTHYLRNGGNASAAARAAGYAHGSAGRRLIQKGTVQNAIQRVREYSEVPETAEDTAETDLPTEINALARVSSDRIVEALERIAFAEHEEPPKHSDSLKALDMLAKIRGDYAENPVYVQVMQYVRALEPEERRELLLDRGRLIEVLEDQGYQIEAAS